VDTIGALDQAGTRYARAVTEAVSALAANDLVGVYLYGSGATGRFVPTRSDLDLFVVLRDWIDPARGRDILSAARAVRRPRSVKGLDLWLVPLSEPTAPSPDPKYVAWALTSIDSEVIGGVDRPGDARLALLFAMCHQHAIALTGRQPGVVFAEVDSEWIVDGMRVDLQMVGPAGWYRVLNACRTMHYLDTGQLCSRAAGVQSARTKVLDQGLLDDALAWRERGRGPVMDPERVEAFVQPVLARLEGRAGSRPLRGVPEQEIAPRVALVHEEPLVTCVLRAPRHVDLLALATRRFSEQGWSHRELLVVESATGVMSSDAFREDRVRSVVVPPGEDDEWASHALQEAKGPVIATWDATTWYSPDRLSQQVAELLSTNSPRLVAPSVLGYDPVSRGARTLRDPAILEQATLCARRHAWDQFGTPARRGERGDLAVRFGPVGADDAEDSWALGDVTSLMGGELDMYAVAVTTATASRQWRPSVSCVMPTYNRRSFAARAIRFFGQQDYPDRELVILDDGEDLIEDLVPDDDPCIRYVRLEDRATIGRKRQLACEIAAGEVLVQWDDDDWFGPTRLSRQVAPLAAGTADITGILKGYLLDLPSFRFYNGGPPLHEGKLHSWIVTGTLAFTRSAWRSTGGYPNSSIGEEVALLRAVMERGGRVAPIFNDGMYVCVRHQSNSWRLYYDSERGPAGWTELAPPQFLPPDDLAFYRSLC